MPAIHASTNSGGFVGAGSNLKQSTPLIILICNYAFKETELLFPDSERPDRCSVWVAGVK